MQVEEQAAAAAVTSDKKLVSDVFGVKDPAFDKMMATVYRGLNKVPKSIDGFRFRADQLRRLIIWAASTTLPANFFKSRMKRNLMIFGPTGCGKTALIQQFAAVTGRPMFRYQCSEDSETSQLFGSWKLCRPIAKEPAGEDAGIVEKGLAGIARSIEKLAIAIKRTTGVGPEMTFVDGPVLRWARTPNSILLLDESDQLHPTVFMSLNGILDGDETIEVPETGEVVTIAPGCLLAATGNTNGRGSTGRGGSSALYRGAKQQNVATMDRFFVIHADYLPEEEEVALLMDQARVKEVTAKAMARLAAQIRERFLGLNDSSADGSVMLPFTVTTRNLLNWAMSYQVLVATKMPSAEALKEALSMTLLDFAAPEERAAVLDTWSNIVGS